jgi:hypothetical protein
MNPVLRTARERGFELLVVTGYSIVLAFALHGDHWISDYALFAALVSILTVAAGVAAGLVLWAIASLCLLGGGSPAVEGGSSPVDAAGGLLALPGTSGEVQR